MSALTLKFLFYNYRTNTEDIDDGSATVEADIKESDKQKCIGIFQKSER